MVSVLVPVRNASATLVGCLRSVLRQRFADFECLIVDDGSTDASPRIAGRFAAADPRFRVLRLPARGLVPALNAGIEAARGSLLARIDADDLMLRDRLGLQVALLTGRSGLAAVGSHVRFFPRRALGPGMREYERWINSLRGPGDVAREAYVECPVAHPTLAIRREVLARYRYRDRDWPEDYDLILRLLGDGLAVGVVPRRLVAWRRLPRRLSATSPRYSIEAFVACKAHHLAHRLLRHTDRYLLWGYGRTGRRLAAALEREGKHPAGIVEIHPGRIGNSIRGAPVLPFEALPRRIEHPLVISVAGTGPRRRIEQALERAGILTPAGRVFAA